MGRKNYRMNHKLPLTPWNTIKTTPYSRCCYCGRELHPGEWHWMRDEFGQKVRKCNNERSCYNHRSKEADMAYKEAMR